MLPALPEDEERRGDGAGQGHRERRPQRPPAEERRTTARPSSRWAPRNTLKKGTAAACSAASHSQPRPAALVAVERDQRAEAQREGREHGVGQGQRDQQVAAQQVRPPVRLRVGREEEREVGGERDEAGEADRERVAARPRASPRAGPGSARSPPASRRSG